MIADIGSIPIRNKSYLVGENQMYDKELRNINNKEERLKQAFYNSYIEFDEFEKEMAVVRNRKDLINKELNKHKQRDVRIKDDMDIKLYATLCEIEKRKNISYYSKTMCTWNSLSYDARRKIVSEYIDNIEIDIEYDKYNNEKRINIKNINIKEKKIDNLAYMFREEIMDMTIKKEEKNILISKPKKKKEIKEFLDTVRKYYAVDAVETTISELKDMSQINSMDVVKIIPIYNAKKSTEQKYTIITI